MRSALRKGLPRPQHHKYDSDLPPSQEIEEGWHPSNNIRPFYMLYKGLP